MTHDELLAKIEVQGTHLQAGDNPYLDALRAVVELHKPVMAFTGGYDGEETELWAEQCQECSGNGYAAMYPCQTIKDIEGQLQ
jgi:hypothetical protein